MHFKINTLFAELRVGKASGEAGRNSRGCGNCRHFYSLLTGTATVAADTIFFPLVVDPAITAVYAASPPECCHKVALMQPYTTQNSIPSGLFQVELIYIYAYITKVACGQASTLWRACTMLKVHVKVTQSCLTLCDPLQPVTPWNSPGENTGVGGLFLLQGIFRTQGLIISTQSFTKRGAREPDHTIWLMRSLPNSSYTWVFKTLSTSESFTQTKS